MLFQFAHTAKGMKNTPKVNEVLNDDALLKRYRKEILDLKKQLEEVCNKYSKTYGLYMPVCIYIACVCVYIRVLLYIYSGSYLETVLNQDQLNLEGWGNPLSW